MPMRGKLDADSVRLQPGKGSKQRGGGPGGAYWHIYVGDKRVGNVYINVIHQPHLGEHASIQIQINKSEQGHGIGSIAYRLACDASQHDIVYAHMRKSNAPSRKAAKAAGFEVVKDERIMQLLMRWQRKRPTAE